MVISTFFAYGGQNMDKVNSVYGLPEEGPDSRDFMRILEKNDRIGVWLIKIDPPVDPSWSVEDKVQHVWGCGRLVWCNPTMAQMYGLTSPVDLFGTRIDQMLPANPKNHAFLTKGVVQGRIDNEPSFETTANGEEVFLNSFEAGSTNPGWLDHAWGIQIRITEEHQARIAAEQAKHEAEEARLAAEEANRQKNEFLATISHELRTPMNVVLGRLNLNHALMEGIAKSESVEDIRLQLEKVLNNNQIMRRNAGVVSRHLEDLLAAGSIESGNLRMNPEELSVLTLSQEVIESLEPQIAKKSIELIQTSRAMPMIWADRIRVKQILYNLLGNAIKFTPNHGTIRIDIGQANGSVEVKICDDGCGIPSDFLPHIFERFRRAENTRTTEGIGIGLSIVKHLTELLGGTVRAESDGDGKGATFAVRFPAHNR